MINIVTDSTCDLPPEWFSRYGITVIPLNIQFGLETFHENVTMTPDTFYRRLEAEQKPPTTSQPSVGEFESLYERLAAGGNEILSIHVTGKLSGTCQGARLSARDLAGKLKITVVDSLTGSAGLGFIVREAAQLVEAGFSVEEIVRRLEVRSPTIYHVFMLNDLRYARMSGRVGRFPELLTTLLDIKPIVGVDAGVLIPLDRIRTYKKGLKRMLELAAAELGDTPVHVGVVHALALAEAEELLAGLQTRLNCQDTFITDLALSLAVHFGPGAVGFVAYPATRG